MKAARRKLTTFEFLRKQIKKHKASLAVERDLVAKLRRHEIRRKDIPGEVIAATLPPQPKGKKTVEFGEFLERGASKITSAATFFSNWINSERILTVRSIATHTNGSRSNPPSGDFYWATT